MGPIMAIYRPIVAVVTAMAAGMSRRCSSPAMRKDEVDDEEMLEIEHHGHDHDGHHHHHDLDDDRHHSVKKHSSQKSHKLIGKKSGRWKGAIKANGRLRLPHDCRRSCLLDISRVSW